MEIILKFSSYTKYSEADLHQMAVDEKWIGDGTSENPYMIESTHSLSDKSVIINSSSHIVIRNCEFDFLSLKKSKNFKFEGCFFDVLELSKCFKIITKNCSFKHSLSIRFSHNLQIQNSHIQILIFSMCYENRFNNCTIPKIYNHFSRANIFENINTSVNLHTIFSIGSRDNYLKYLGLIIAGVISIVSAIVFILLNYPDLFLWSLIGGIILMACFTILIPTALYLDYKRMRDYPDNQIF